MQEYNYLMQALASFNIDIPQWYGWKKYNDDGSAIPNSQRMCYECIILNDDTAVMPTEAEVNEKIAEIKQQEQDMIDKKTSAKQKLKDLGLDDAEIKALTGA